MELIVLPKALTIMLHHPLSLQYDTIQYRATSDVYFHYCDFFNLINSSGEKMRKVLNTHFERLKLTTIVEE